MRIRLSRVFFVSAMIAGACSKPTPPPSLGSTDGESPAASGTSRVVCTLDCSGNEAKGYGATEEEARADVRRHVSEQCAPDDGQYFIFCEPAR